VSALRLSPRGFLALARLCGLAVFAFCAAVLAGWALGLPGLTRLASPWLSMKPVTAVALQALGLALVLSGASAPAILPRARIAARVAIAAFAAALGLLVILEYSTSAEFGIDRFLFAPAIGRVMAEGRNVRMATLSAVCLVLLGSASALRRGPGRGSGPARILAIVAMLLAFASLLTIALDVHPQRGIGSWPSMSIPTAACVLLLALGQTCLDPDEGIWRHLRRPGPAGIVARRLLPGSIVVPPVIAALKLAGDRLGVYEPSFGVILVALTYVVLLFALLLWTVGSLERSAGVRAEAESALKRRDELLALTGELAKVGGWEFDAATGVGSWTEEVARIHGVDPDTVTDESFGLGFYEGESRAMIEGAIDEALRLAKPYDLELDLHAADGELKQVRTIGLPVVNEGRVVGLRGIFQDVTELRRVQAALLQSEERFSKAFASSPVGQSISTLAAGILIDVNAAYCRIMGYEREELIGRSSLDLNLFAEAADRAAIVDEVLRLGFAKDRHALARSKSGEIRDVMISMTPISLEGKSCLISTLIDVTDRLRAEAEVRALNTELEERVRRRTAQLEEANAELESFSYSVSHDLRSPLRGIDGWSSALEEDYGPSLDRQALGYLSRVRAETRRMATLIDSLLQLAKVGRAEMASEELDLSELAESVAAGMRESNAGRDIEFRVEPSLRARGDRRLLEIVLVNLFDNACKFTARKERCLIEFGRLAAPAGDPGEGASPFYVRDNGAGFDMAYAQKLFAPFQRMHKSSEYPGTGIGLATVHRIIAKHGGRIWAEAKAGEGAAFYFTLEERS
jgi:PAS domain S-box-containing protein